jgi:hypothetical protein
MKKIFWIMSLIVASCSWSYAQNQDPYNDNTNSDDTYYNNDNSGYNEQQSDNDGVSYQTFYDQLSPYGSWINYPGYGYVWEPQQANPGFSPYSTDGHWVYTDMGWTWASDYAWGWATFHYGRWFEDPEYGGWLWMPGYDWAPAWVTWGQYDGYYCWAPVGPRDYVNGHWGYGNYDHHWNCLPQGHMGEQHISGYIVNNTVVDHDRKHFESAVAIIRNNNTYNGSVFNAGPRAQEVEKITGRPIAKVAINNTSTPGKTQVRGNEINIYRPAVNRNPNQQHAVPGKVVNPAEQHNTTNPARNEQRTTTTPERNTPTPARENTNTERTQPERTQPERSQPSWSAPRQSTPQESRPSGGFIPSERPAQQMPRSEPMQQRSAPMQQHSAPAPSFHASPSMGGGARGGRH